MLSVKLSVVRCILIKVNGFNQQGRERGKSFNLAASKLKFLNCHFHSPSRKVEKKRDTAVS